MPRTIAYGFVALVLGFIGGVVLLEALIPGASKAIKFSLLAVIVGIFTFAGVSFARFLNKKDSSKINSLRLNFTILGLLNLVLIGFSFVGINLSNTSFSLIIGITLTYAFCVAIAYVYLAITLPKQFVANGLKYVKIFLIVQFVVLQVISIVGGSATNWLNTTAQGLILLYLFIKTRQLSVLDATFQNNP